MERLDSKMQNVQMSQGKTAIHNFRNTTDKNKRFPIKAQEQYSKQTLNFKATEN